MQRMRSYWLSLAFLGTLLAAFLGMSWNMLESRASFPPGTRAMLGAAVVAAAISRVGGKSPALLTILVVGTAVPSGAFAAMLAGMFKDPTSQNLWPIAVAVLAVAAFAASSVGTLLGSFLLLMARGSSGKKGT